MIRRLVILLGWILVASAGLLGAAFALAQTRFAKDQIARAAESWLAQEGRRAELVGLSGLLPFSVRVGELRLADGTGPWLELRGAEVNLDPTALVRGRLVVRSARAQELRIVRRPEPGPVPRRRPPGQGVAGWWTDPPLVAEELVVESLILEEPVLGAALGLRLVGRAQRLEEDGLAFRLALARTDGGAGEVRIEGRWERDAGRLTASARGRLDSDLAQTLLRAPAAGALVFSAQLAGPLDRLRGEVRIEAEGLFAVEAEGSGSLNADGADLRTDLRLALADTDARPAWLRLLGQEARASLGLRWRRDGGLVVEPLRVQGAGLVAEGSIARGPGARWPVGRLEIRLTDLGMLAAGRGMPLGGSLRLLARGGEEEAGWAWELEGQGVRIGRIGLPGLRGSGRVEPAAESAAAVPDVLVSGVVRAARLAQAGLSAPELELALRFRPGEPVALERLLLAAPELRATLTGSVDPQARTGSGRFQLEIPDPPAWLAALGRPVPDWLGIGAVEGDGTWTLEDEGRMSGRLALAGKSLRLGPQRPEAREGPFALRAAWLRTRDRFAVPEFTLEAAAVRARGELGYRFAESRLRARVGWEIPDLAALAGAGTAGALQGRIAADGPIGDVALRIAAEASALAAAGAVAEEVRLDARMRIHEGRASGRFTLLARRGDANITVEGGAAFGAMELEVEEVRIGGSGIEGRLAGVFDRLRGRGRGTLRLVVDDLGQLAPFFDRPVQGDVRLEAAAAEADAAQSLDFALKVRGLALPTGSLEEGELSGRIQDLFNRAEADVRLEMRGIDAPDLLVDRLRASLVGEGGRYRISGEAQGRRTQPFALEAGGQLELASDRQLLRLDRLQGMFEGQRLRLRRPATAVLRDGLLDVDVIDLEIGEGELQGGLRFGESELAVAFRGRDLPVGLVTGNPLAPARADLALKLEGERAALGGRIDLAVRAARADTAEVARLRGRMADGMLDLDLRIEGGRAEMPLAGALRLPLAATDTPPFLRIDPSAPVSGRLQGMVDLGRLGFLLPHDRLLVEGLAQLDLKVAGEGGRPEIRGTLAWRQGRMEDAQSGVVIRDAEARLRVSGSRLELVELRARDAGDGRLRARGWAELDGWMPDRYRIEVMGRDFIVLNAPRGWLVAEGEVVFERAPAGARLAGSVRIQRGELWLGRGRGAAPPALAVLERGDDGVLRPIEAPTRPGERRMPLSELALDLRLEAPQRLYLRGAGLESEWGGSLRIRGRAREPEVEGALKVRRGRLDFLGQRFAVEQGEILLAGGLPPRIDVDLIARAERAGIQARVELRGPIDRPELVLASDPALPRDEILARLLFGQSAQRLDASQGVRLAAALQALELDRFTEVLDRLKEFVQMDTLGIREGESGAGIAAGKYLNDQVFVEVEQEFGASPTKVRVEVEITPSLSLNSEVDTEGEGEVELEWRFDY